MRPLRGKIGFNLQSVLICRYLTIVYEQMHKQMNERNKYTIANNTIEYFLM